jgi:hypothetical protein
MDAPPADSRECQFCSAWFSRVDAARRHAKRCQKRKGRILLDRKRGRPARSCDQCSRVKVHCKANDEGPCERCIPRGLRCTLDRRNTDLVTDRAPAVESPDQSGQRDDRMALSSLLNLTDDHQDYLTEQTIGMEPDGVPLGPIFLPPNDADALSSDMMDCLDPSILLLFDYEPSTTPVTLDGQHSNHGEDHHDDLPYTKSWESTMSARLGLLEVELSKHAASSYNHSLSFDLQSYRSFFNVSNVHRFITTFCRKRHYRYPIIHWPTFEVEKASLALLLVVALTGAAYSLGRDHGAAFAVQAREFYKLADAYVFQVLQNHMSGLQINSLDSIELCQAALLMYALDTLPTGDAAMQHTAIAMRLPMLVTALRKLDFVNVRHEASEDWQTFIRHEQMIRIVAWTFCADCLATLTCNKPPSFATITEMRGDLPCDPKVWEADAASFPEFWACSRQSASFNLKDLMSRWLNNDLLTSIDHSRLPVFCLHIMLCGTSLSGRLFVYSSLTFHMHSFPANRLQLARRNVSGPAIRTAATGPRSMETPLGLRNRATSRDRSHLARSRKTCLRSRASYEADHRSRSFRLPGLHHIEILAANTVLWHERDTRVHARLCRSEMTRLDTIILPQNAVPFFTPTCKKHARHSHDSSEEHRPKHVASQPTSSQDNPGHRRKHHTASRYSQAAQGGLLQIGHPSLRR